MKKVRVICDLPNASLLISGVVFSHLEDGGVISEPLDQEAADDFLSINGYSLYESDEDEVEAPKAPPVEPPPVTRAPTKAEKAAAAKAAAEAKAAEDAKVAEVDAAVSVSVSEAVSDTNINPAPEDGEVF
jgi:hypothetical protein